jgi:hypothetical protein
MARAASFCFPDSKIKKWIHVENNLLAKIFIPKYHAIRYTKRLKNEAPNSISIFGLISYITTTVLSLIRFALLIINPMFAQQMDDLFVINFILVTLLHGLNIPRSHPMKILFYIISPAIITLIFIFVFSSIKKGFGA